MLAFNERFEHTIIQGGWLTDDHIDTFAHMLHQQKNFEFRPSYFQMLPECVNPVDPNRKHIQILHRLEGDYSDPVAYNMYGGHWVCSYYDKTHLFIFDSTNNKILDVHYKNHLQLLYPHYSFERNPVQFPTVQQQPNGCDCGVFAIAFAVSLALDEDPSNILYNHTLMRDHLLNMYRRGIISPFPKLNNVPLRTVPIIASSTDEKNNRGRMQLRSAAKSKVSTNILCSDRYKCNAKEIIKDLNKKSKKQKKRIPLIPALTDVDRNQIINDCMLTDNHMDKFGALMAKFSDYYYCYPGYLQNPNSIEPIPIWKKHIQILFSSDHHWVCSYYDTNNIYIYDSLNRGKLHDDQKIFLQHLHPYFQFNKKVVIFPKVQQQNNSVDCGVFAIAFSVSLLFNLKPEFIIYDDIEFREHLAYMFEKNKIDHFPTIFIRNMSGKLPKLNVIKNREVDACRKRKLRYEARYLNDDCDNKNTAEDLSLLNSNTIIAKIVDNKNDIKTSNIKPLAIKRSAPRDTFQIENEHQNQKKFKFDSGCQTEKENTNKKYVSFDLPNDVVDGNHSPVSAPKEITQKQSMFHPKLSKEIYVRKLYAKIRSPSVKKILYDDKNKDNMLGINDDDNLDMAVNESMEIDNECLPDELTQNDDDTFFDEECVTNVECRLKAEKIIKWVLHHRYTHVKNLSHSKKMLKAKAAEISEIVDRIPASNTDKRIDSLCGKALHTMNSESYFYEMIYSFNLKDTVIEINHEGKATNILPLQETAMRRKRKKMQWPCDVHCRTKIENMSAVFDNYEKLLASCQNLNLNNVPQFCAKLFSAHTDAVLLGHPLSCYMSENNCISPFTAVEVLSSHFVSVRRVKRLIYRIKNSYKKISEIDESLESVDCGKLKSLSEEAVHTAKKHYLDNSEILLDEDEIESRYHAAFLALTTFSYDTPSNICISCRKLCFRRNVSIISNLRKGIDNQLWNDLMNFLDDKDAEKTEFICQYCLQKFRANVPPPTCIMNNLYVSRVPEEIAVLTDHERMLIQRAKAYQVVQGMGTVAKKNMPNHIKIQKAVGRMFYLPLSIEETLEKICPPTTAISDNQEFYILVNGLPTKANKVWQNLVDVKKVFNALLWLKLNNPHYSEIILPNSYEKLLDNVEFSDIEFNVNETGENIPANCVTAVYSNSTNSKSQIDKCVNRENDAHQSQLIEQFDDFDLSDIEFQINENCENMPTNCVTAVYSNSTNSESPINKCVNHENDTHPSQLIEQCDDVDLSDVEFQMNANCENFLTNSVNPVYSNSTNSKSSINKCVNRENDTHQLHLIKQFDNMDELYDLTGKKLLNMNHVEKVPMSPFLTQIHDPELYYEHYTLYPLHNRRKNDTATNMYQMKKIREKPLDNREKNLDLLCFPELYPTGENGLREDRNFKLTDYSYAQLRLSSSNSRFRLNQQYIFHLLYEATIRQINAGIYHALNVINPRQKYTAHNYIDKLNKGELEGNLNTIFERLPNSEAYWRKPRNDLKCMTREYGPATFFLTLSPAEWLCDDLVQYIRDVNHPKFDKLSANACIAKDPVSVARFLDNKFKGMLDFLMSEANVIGQIRHYFWRREYQGRGVQHFHLLLWVEDAPVMGKNTDEEVQEFIQKYITCRLPDKHASPTLYRRVDTHQRHKHNSYCMRSKKEKSGAINKRCKFGFARSITKDFVLRNPAISILGRRQLKTKCRLYDLPRNAQEVNINDYNPVILCAWEGNMDIQYIGEASTLLTQYCTKYVTKNETAAIADSINDINSNKSLRQRLYSFAFKSLHNREIGALEAADILLGMSLYGTDPETTIKWLNVNQIRSRKLKSREDVAHLSPDSTEIFCPSLIDTIYPNRPYALESTSLYEFAKWYDVVKSKPKNEATEIHDIGGSCYLKRRKRGYLINHYRYNVKTQPENYFYAILLLHQPWRNTEELKNGYNTYTESFASTIDCLSQAAKYHNGLTDLQNGLDNIHEEIAKLMSENDDDKGDAFSVDEVDEDAVNDFKGIGQKAIADINVTQMISELNADQFRIFVRVQKALRGTNNDGPLRLCVSGEGGTGKSRLIDTIRSWIKTELNKETAVTAPTGLAAFNITGLTVHRVFQLPVEHGRIPKYNELSDAALKIMREQFKDVELIIIDEISMISNVVLVYICLRLIQIFNTEDYNGDGGWFGGKHILVFGDFLQLPPVRQLSVYENIPLNIIEHLLGSLINNYNIWQEQFQYDELQINMRQKTDQVYGDLLSRLRIGNLTGADVTLLQQRLIKFDASLSYNDRLRELCNYINNSPVDTVVLLPTCKQCEIINTEMLNQIPSEEISLLAEDAIDCPKKFSKKANEILRKLEDDPSNTAGLEKVILLKIGAKIMIRRNIDISLGLVNGAICKVLSVSKSFDSLHVEKLTILLGNGQKCELERVSVKFQIMEGAYVIRKQFPISLSYGITIHKSQGLSLQNAIVDVGNSVFTSGQTYVALSRVTTLQGLHLINFDPSKAEASTSAIKEYNRLRKIHRPDLSQISIPYKHFATVSDFIWAVPEQDYNLIDNNNVAPVNSLSWQINGLHNNSGVYSYANATLQCIFHCELFRNALLLRSSVGTPLNKLLTSYINDATSFDTREVREFAGDQFLNSSEQDPSMFLEALITKIDELKKIVNGEIDIKERCKRCNYSNSYTSHSAVTLLSHDCQKDKITLQNLILNSQSHWCDFNRFCQNCSMDTNMIRKSIIKSTNDIFIIKLNLFSEKGYISRKLLKGFLKDVQLCKITLCDKTYSVISGIFTCDDSLYDGHWKSILRDGNTRNWFSADDLTVRKQRWPTHAKNAYLLFLQKLKK